jgi:hypothetical protein
MTPPELLNPTMSRRVFIGATAYIVSVPLLASILKTDNELIKIIDQGQFFTPEELTILTDVAEIMIPKTDTPGATDAKVAPVLDGLMVTWANDQTKQQFKTTLMQIDTLARDTYQQSYTGLGYADRQQMITELDKAAFTAQTSQLSINYRRLKELIFHVFYSSEEANPDFVLIPGHYYGDLTKSQFEKVKRGETL